MGYYTQHEFVSADGGDEEAIKECIKEISDYSYVFNDSCKWYDCESDMAEVSKRFPDILIVISGNGEESGDIWRLAAKNGKTDMVKAELSFREFNI